MSHRSGYFDDFYLFNFTVDADIEEFTLGRADIIQAMPGRTHGTLKLENRLGGSFEMSTRPNDFGTFMRYDVGQGGSKGNVVEELISDANFGHKIAGMLEKYGDHLLSCRIKIEGPRYWDDEDGDYFDNPCTCGFQEALARDESNTRRRNAQ